MYVKLFSDILQSSLWAEDAETKVVWITMLALANADGLVRATAPGIAHEARVDLQKTKTILTLLESPDPESRTPDHEGCRIERVDGGFLILNYLKYRSLSDEDMRREQGQIRTRRYRERHAVSRSVTLRNAPSRQAEAEAEAEAEPSPPPPSQEGSKKNADIFLRQFPRNDCQRGQVYKLWEEAQPNLDCVMARLGQDLPELKKRKPGMIPGPATYLENILPNLGAKEPPDTEGMDPGDLEFARMMTRETLIKKAEELQKSMPHMTVTECMAQIASGWLEKEVAEKYAMEQRIRQNEQNRERLA